jgi:hypothetical protein
MAGGLMATLSDEAQAFLDSEVERSDAHRTFIDEATALFNDLGRELKTINDRLSEFSLELGIDLKVFGLLVIHVHQGGEASGPSLQ